jgi:hypothetical protein
LIMPTTKYSELWDIFSNISVLLDSAKSYCGIYTRYIQKKLSTSTGKKATCSYYNNGLCQRKFLTLFSELHKVHNSAFLRSCLGNSIINCISSLEKYTIPCTLKSCLKRFLSKSCLYQHSNKNV